MADASPHDDRLRHYWDRHANSYDRQMGFFERRLMGDTRSWVCAQAYGRVLEIAVGTGLNFPHYRPEVELIGVEWSARMLAIARHRARELTLRADLREGDAQRLDFPADAFDSVVCTLSLCAIPDHRRALTEMHRVLRPGGLLLLADHVAAPSRTVRAVQAVIELASIPMGGEHLRRRPLLDVRAMPFEVERQERFKLGLIERVAARKR